MDEANTGGPAYPVPSLVHHGHVAHGMTLRDYFAAKVIQAIVSRGVVPQVPLESYAENAYKMADAMLKAREQ